MYAAVAIGRAIVLGDILAIHVDDHAILDNAGQIDAAALDVIARMHGAEYYLRADDPFRIERL